MNATMTYEDRKKAGREAVSQFRYEHELDSRSMPERLVCDLIEQHEEAPSLETLCLLLTVVDRLPEVSRFEMDDSIDRDTVALVYGDEVGL